MKNLIFIAVLVVCTFYIGKSFGKSKEGRIEAPQIAHMDIKLPKPQLDSLYLISKYGFREDRETVIYLQLNPVEKQQPTLIIVSEPQDLK